MLTVNISDIQATTGLTGPTISTKFKRIPALKIDGRKSFDLVNVIPMCQSARLRRCVPDLIAVAKSSGDHLYCGPAAEVVRAGRTLVQWMEPAARDRLAGLRVRFAEGLGRSMPGGSLHDYLPLLEQQLVCHPAIYKAAICNDRRDLPEDWAKFSIAFAVVNASHVYNEAA